MESLSLLHLDSALEFRGGQRQEELLLLGLRERGHRQILLCCPEGGLARRLLGLGLRWAPERLPQPGELLLWPCAARNHPAVALCAAHAAYLWPLALPIAHTAHAPDPGGYDCIVNCTSVGMEGTGTEAASPCDFAGARPGALAVDIVYKPEETAFLRAAKSAGLRTLGGLPMLIYQGALAFELWTGVPAPVEVMFDAARRRLREQHP